MMLKFLMTGSEKVIDEKRVIIIENFYMPQLNRHRTVRIYLPLGYDKDNESYPVLYMHDGQNMFYDDLSYSGHSWRACETLDSLEQEGVSKGIILATVDNSDLREGLGRLDEYSPWEKNFMGERIDRSWRSENNYGGEGDAYADFVATTLKDYVDKNYRTKKDRTNTFIGGSSMGALISLYTGFKYSDRFSKLALVSPAFWFAYDNLKEYLETTKLENELYIYMDMGTNETSDHSNPDFPAVYLDSAKGIEKILRKNVGKMDFYTFEGHEHSERAWALRFPQIIKNLLGRNNG